MGMVRVKIKKIWHYGDSVGEVINGMQMVRYKSGDTFLHGWFKESEIETTIKWPELEHYFRITNNMRIICRSCGYKTVQEQKDKYGYCPECMSMDFEETEYMGTY